MTAARCDEDYGERDCGERRSMYGSFHWLLPFVRKLCASADGIQDVQVTGEQRHLLHFF